MFEGPWFWGWAWLELGAWDLGFVMTPSHRVRAFTDFVTRFVLRQFRRPPPRLRTSKHRIRRALAATAMAAILLSPEASAVTMQGLAKARRGGTFAGSCGRLRAALMSVSQTGDANAVELPARRRGLGRGAGRVVGAESRLSGVADHKHSPGPRPPRLISACCRWAPSARPVPADRGHRWSGRPVLVQAARALA